MTAPSIGALPSPRQVIFRVEALADPRIRLFLTSTTLLFVELLLIRWIPANVRYVGFFSNFLLMASFLGIGIGILLGRRGWRLPFSPFTSLLFVVVILVFAAQLNVQVRSQDELFFGLAENTAADANFIVLPLVVGLVAAVMAALALPLGPLFRAMRPLHAYAIDIVGSMTGIVAFTALSAVGTNPFVWFSVLAILVLLMALGGGITPWSFVAGAAMVGVIFAVLVQAGSGDVWSPYYRITTYRTADQTLTINVNGIPHQAIHPVDGPKEPFYDQVYEWFPGRTFDDVLIVGAGSGSDVAIALDRGAKHVDAVEIDPAIQRIGIEENPDHPYDDPRVTRIVNDGRAYLRTTEKQYDLVVFALPDSLTLVSTAANIRLESFLFTEQAFASVRDHLKPGGIFVLYNYYREPWLVAKLQGMLTDAFGSPPLVRTYSDVQAALAAGPGVAAVGGVPPGDGVSEVPDPGPPEPRPATDDWPFLYLRTGFVAPYYLVALAIILGFALVAVLGAARVTGTPIRRFSPHFFVLGTAFLLLETRSLVSFSLLFGTTWIVNALAFFAILASVLVAILINARFPIRHPNVFYFGLFVALGIAFLLPPEQLLIDPPWLRYVVAAALAFTPVFFANLVFSHSFRDTTTADMAFASNLLGAMVGGALEYLALLTGYRALLPLVAILYLLAWLFATRWRRLADRDL
ncbi:MAG TPA: spermidine synthase, partial [Candidatus Saccharimonadia bacterium]|nr:spermidine synthase [Candidatus Saccharimonadia bacterium]